jgi:hypothetical protein
MDRVAGAGFEPATFGLWGGFGPYNANAIQRLAALAKAEISVIRSQFGHTKLRLVTIRINSLRFRTQLHDQERSFRSGCLSRRYLSLDSRGRIAFGCTQIVRCLQILPAPETLRARFRPGESDASYSSSCSFLRW